MFFNIFQFKYIHPLPCNQSTRSAFRIQCLLESNSERWRAAAMAPNYRSFYKLSTFYVMVVLERCYVMVVLERCYGGIAWRRRRRMRRIMPCRLSCLRPNIILRRIANIHVVWTSTMHEFLFEGVWNRSETISQQQVMPTRPTNDPCHANLQPQEAKTSNPTGK